MKIEAKTYQGETAEPEAKLPASLLFVCTGNTCRSPMAAALTEALLAQQASYAHVVVQSAGLAAWPGDEMSAEAQEVLRTCYRIRGDMHRAQRITLEHVEAAEMILTMTQQQALALRQAIQNGQLPGHFDPW